jgi:hypothetical protein
MKGRIAPSDFCGFQRRMSPASGSSAPGACADTFSFFNRKNIDPAAHDAAVREAPHGCHT